MDKTMKRLFAVWNRNYKPCFVVADEPSEAVSLCVISKHIRKPHLYRKFEDFTERILEGSDATRSSLLALLEGGRSGIVTQNDEGVWEFA